MAIAAAGLILWIAIGASNQEQHVREGMNVTSRASLLSAPQRAKSARAPSRVPREVHPHFIENCGQIDGPTRFYVRRDGMVVHLTPEAAIYSLFERGRGRDCSKARLVEGRLESESGARGAAVWMTFLGARRDVRLEGRDERSSQVNVYRGDDSARWREGLPTYGEVIYRGVYPGIDLVYRTSGSELKGEWRVEPGASAAEIRLRYEGAKSVSLESDGGLRIETECGILRESAPVLFQDSTDERLGVSGGYEIGEDGEVGFWVGAHEPDLPLIIDPNLEWSTYLGGGSVDIAYDLTVDASGNVYVTGETGSTDFPTTSGAFDRSWNGGFFGDAFVTKLDASGSGVLYSTFLGGSGGDAAGAVFVDDSGAVFLSGGAGSSDFPTTAGAFDRTYEKGEAFVSKLEPSGGSLVYSTFLGGSLSDGAGTLWVDGSGNARVAGYTHSPDFPTTAGAYDTSKSHTGSAVFVSKLSADGSALLYSTFVEGSKADIVLGLAVDGTGNAYVTGYTWSADFAITSGAFDTSFNGGSQDGFVFKLDPSGSALLYSTFLGGSGNEAGAGIAVDDTGHAYVVGSAGSTDFPTTPGAFSTSNNGTSDAFATKIDPSGSSLVYSTFLGGRCREAALDVGVDALGNAYLVGQTDDYPGPPFLPTTHGAFDTSHNGAADVFVAKIDVTGSNLIYSTFLGGGAGWPFDYGNALALDGRGNVYVTGSTGSLDFPTTGGAYSTTHNDGFTDDAFVTKLRLGPTLAFTGTPSAGSPVSFEVSSAPSSETGRIAQVALSCSGTSGIRLPAGSDQVLPLTWDVCTSLSLSFPAAFQGTVDSKGNAATPVIPFPSVPAGIQVYAAAFTWQFGVGFLSVTPPISFVTQ